MAFRGNDACRFGKVSERGDMASGVMVDHLDTITCRVCDEDATARRLKGAVVEHGARGIRDLDYANRFKGHCCLLNSQARTSSPPHHLDPRPPRRATPRER